MFRPEGIDTVSPLHAPEHYPPIPDPTTRRVWSRMSESEKGSGIAGKAASVDFMSTHPANEKRIKVRDDSY